MKPNKKLPGIAMPTNRAFLKPKIPKIITITIAIAAMTLLPNSLKIFLTVSVISLLEYANSSVFERNS